MNTNTTGLPAHLHPAADELRRICESKWPQYRFVISGRQGKPNPNGPTLRHKRPK